MPDVVENTHTVYFCPACARVGRGGMQLHRIFEDVCRPRYFECWCGWSGPETKAQQYSYPCKTYRTVEMDVPVLISMWESLRPEKEVELDPERTQVPFVLIGDAERFPSAMNVWIGQALDFLVNKEFLPPAHYKLDDPAQTR